MGFSHAGDQLEVLLFLPRGSSQSSDIACDWDGAVSHRHAKIELDPDGNAFLFDLGSTNGTMLNGQLISANKPVKLKDGDRISIGGKTALIIHGPQQ